MRFGYDEKLRVTGAGLYSRVMTLIPLLPAIYIFMVSGYPGIIAKKGLLAFLCNVGFAALPRYETAFLSWLYRLTSSEAVVDLVMLALAVAFGVISMKLLRGRRPVPVRIVFLAVIAADLIYRLIPTTDSLAFGPVPEALGFAIRLGCGVVIALDIIAEKKRAKNQDE